MTDVIVFHHARGRTPGVVAFAEQLSGAGHCVSVPDLYAGRTFDSTEAGVAHAQEVGFGTVIERGQAAAVDLPPEVVYLGFSLGVLPAQALAQTRPGARGAVFAYSAVAPENFGIWPPAVPVEIHAMDADPSFVDEGDIDAARQIVSAADDAELFLYPGQAHLFADSSTEDYDPDAAALFTERVLAFLARVG